MDFKFLDIGSDEQDRAKLFTLTGKEEHWHVVVGGIDADSPQIDAFNDIKKSAGLMTGCDIAVDYGFYLNETFSPDSKIIIAPGGDIFSNVIKDQFIDAIMDKVIEHPESTYFLLTKNLERAKHYFYYKNKKNPDKFPIKNLALGTICNNTKTYQQRTVAIVQVPVQARFLMIEPLTEGIKPEFVVLDTRDIMWPFKGIVQAYLCTKEDGKPEWDSIQNPLMTFKPVDWIVMGGKFGGAPCPIHPAWMHRFAILCERHNIPFYFKGWGDYNPTESPDLENDETLIIFSANGTIRGKGIGGKTNFLSTQTMGDIKDIYLTKLTTTPVESKFKNILPDFRPDRKKIKTQQIQARMDEINKRISG